MSYNRLGGKGRKLILTEAVPVSRLHIQKLDTIDAALRLSRRRIFLRATDEDVRRDMIIADKPVDGNEERLATALDQSEQLVMEALDADPRLARKSQWLRAEEGESFCPGLIAAGDDKPAYKYHKAVLNAATQVGEPIRIVVSTDDKDIPPGTAAAFIATVRIVQQFMPVEVWWQGAWLNETRSRGFVTLVPLVQGDMDFSRLDYFISDQTRDIFSFRCMSTYAVYQAREIWNGCGTRADRQYLDLIMGRQYQSNVARFVSHTGITPDGNSVAHVAANWLGWESLYWAGVEEKEKAESAAQKLPDPPSNYTPAPPQTEADKKYWEDYYKREAERKAKEAKERMDNAQ